MRRPGELAAVILLGVGVTTSAVLCATGHDSICTCVRSNRVLRAVALGVVVHAAFNLPHDPLRWIGSIAMRHLQEVP